MQTTKTIILTKDKDCKHSVRFAADAKETDPLVGSVYVNRPHFAGEKQVRVTISVIGDQIQP